MSMFSPVVGDQSLGSERSQPSRVVSLLTRHPLAMAALVVAVTTLLRLSGTVDSDVSWQLWIAHQVNGGAQLHRDIIEVNPPLWFWMAIPVDWTAALLQVRAESVLIVAIGCLVILALAATGRCLPDLDQRRRTLLLAYAALILAAMPGMQVGQREQLVLIAALPYAALAAARRSGRDVPDGLAAMIGAAAALGFALKHYFLIVPLLIELWLIAAQRKSWRPLRPESIAIVAVGLAYAVAVLVLSPRYLTDIVPLVTLAYAVTGAPRLFDLVQPGLMVGTATLAVLAMPSPSRKDGTSSFASALGIAAIGFAADYLLQAKGWPYHALPLMGCAAIALAASLLGSVQPSRLTVCLAPALLVMPLVLSIQQAMRETAPSPDLRRAVSGLRPGEAAGFIATDPAFAWSIVMQKHLAYPSRYMGFWMMRAVVQNEVSGSPNRRLTELGRRVVRETVDDFRCMPPRRIVVARPSPGARGEFDILPFFLRDPQFAELLSHYTPVERTSVEVFERSSPIQIADRSTCRVVR